MSMTIFPNSVPDAEWQIILSTDGTGLSNLIRVNKAAASVLTNENFKLIFEFKYPHLGGLYRDPDSWGAQALDFLQRFRPDVCWKVATHARAVPDINSFAANCSTDQFLFAGFPYECKALAIQKAELEKEREKICGSYPYDPDSAIHQAWKLSQAVEESSTLTELEQISADILEKVHTNEEIQALPNIWFEALYGFAKENGATDRESATEVFSNLTENEALNYWINNIESQSDEEFKPLKREHSSTYRRYFKLYSDLARLENIAKEGSKLYAKLERERVSIESEIEAARCDNL